MFHIVRTNVIYFISIKSENNTGRVDVAINDHTGSRQGHSHKVIHCVVGSELDTAHNILRAWYRVNPKSTVDRMHFQYDIRSYDLRVDQNL